MRPADSELAWRELRAGDRDLWVSLYTDAGTMRFIGVPLAPEAAVRSFEQALGDPGCCAGPYRVLVDRHVGPIGLGLLAPVGSPGVVAEVEVGIVLAERYRRRGIGGRGLALLMADARQRLGPVAVSVQYRRDHRATARMVAALGFVDSGESKAPGWVHARLGVKPPTAGPAVDHEWGMTR